MPGAAAVVLVVLSAFITPSIAQSALDKPVSDLVRAMGSDESSGTERLGAARTLAALCRSDDDAFNAVNEILSPANDGATAQVYLLRAIGELGYAPDRLLHPLGVLAERAGDRRLPAVLSAIAQIKTRSAAGALMAYARPDRTQATREAAYGALRELSGRDDIPNDFPAWLDWLKVSMQQTEDEWIASLARAQATRATALARERDALASELRDAYRRLHVATPIEQRGQLLVSLLTDRRAQLRELGFELTARELSAARTLDPAVPPAAISLLSHPDPATRERAATLLNQLALPAAEPAVIEALTVETDPVAARAMIQLLRRWPSMDGVRLVVDWLERDPGVRSTAIDTLAVYKEKGVLDDELAGRVVDVLETMPVNDLGASACVLLVTLGDDQDVQLVMGLLDSDRPESRLAAANSLVSRPEAVNALLGAAQRDPALFDAAARAVESHRPDADAFRVLLKLENADPERRRKLLRIARSMSPADLITIAREQEDDAFRESILSALTASERKPADDPEQLDAYREALLELATVRLLLNRPEGVLTVLDLIPASEADGLQTRIRDLRASALIRLERIEQAELLEVDADIWLDALSHRLESEAAQSISTAIRRQFDGTLTEEQLQRLEEMESLLRLREIRSDEQNAEPGETPDSPGGEGQAEPAENGSDRG